MARLISTDLPTRRAEHVQASGDQGVEHSGCVGKQCGIGLTQIGVVARPITRIAPPPVGCRQHLLAVIFPWDRAE